MSEISPLRPLHLSISCAGAFPVRTSAQPAREPDWLVSDPACFSRWPGSFASYDPESSSWRTSQRSLLGGWIPYSGRWPLSGMMRAGEVCEHQRWAHRTDASAGSVSRGWPTPAAQTFDQSPEVFDARRARLKLTGQNGNGAGRLLAVEVRRSWPTMTTSEAERGHGYQRAQGRIDPTLTGATGAAQAWPTPIATDTEQPTNSLSRLVTTGQRLCKGDKRRSGNGATAARTTGATDTSSTPTIVPAHPSSTSTLTHTHQAAWPTPMTCMHSHLNLPPSTQEWDCVSGAMRREGERGRLNPEWVETLQGFPVGWTSTDGPPLRDHSTHGSHRAPDHDSPTTGTD